MLTRNISLHELRQRARHGFAEEPYPKKWVESRAKKVATIVQRVRDHFAKPAIIVSGYRSPAYNRKIGGSRKSQHKRGRAIDFKIKGVSAKRVHDWVLAQYRAGKMPELGGLGSYPGFTHVDIRKKWRKRLARWGGKRKTT